MGLGLAHRPPQGGQHTDVKSIFNIVLHWRVLRNIFPFFSRQIFLGPCNPQYRRVTASDACKQALPFCRTWPETCARVRERKWRSAREETPARFGCRACGLRSGFFFFFCGLGIVGIRQKRRKILKQKNSQTCAICQLISKYESFSRYRGAFSLENDDDDDDDNNYSNNY